MAKTNYTVEEKKKASQDMVGVILCSALFDRDDIADSYISARNTLNEMGIYSQKYGEYFALFEHGRATEQDRNDLTKLAESLSNGSC